MISSLIDYAYTGEIPITKHNVQSMLSAANLLEILPVRDACCQFLDRNMDETVFHACLRWLTSQQRVPKSFHPVLEHVRLPLLTPYFIHDVVARSPAVSESPECRQLVEEAR